MDANEFLKIIEPKETKNHYKLGKIDPAYISGNPKIVFDGELVASAKQYPFISTYTPVANDRVLLMLVASSYVVMGSITGDSSVFPKVGFPNSLGANGYQKLPSGLIIQWGKYQTTALGANSTNFLTFNLPIAFNTIFSLSGGIAANAAWDAFRYGIFPASNSVGELAMIVGATAQAFTLYWIAVGI